MGYEKRWREQAEELALVDHPSGLLPWQLRFCQLYAINGQVIDAMKQVVSTEDLGRSDHSLRTQAYMMLKKPAVVKYIHSLQQRLEDMGVASMLEVQMFLTDAIRTPIDQIDGSHPLCQKKVTNTRTDKDGNTTVTETLESISKMDAAKTLIKMKGWDAPIKVDHNHTGGVMLVPMAGSVEDWEKAALQSQEELMKDAIDV